MNQNVRGAAAADPRDGAGRYLPLDRLSAERFLNDHEPLAAAVLARLRVRETDATLSRIFQRALQALPAFRGECRLSSWVYRIAWREGLRQVARERAQDAREAPLEIAVRHPDGAESAAKVRSHRALTRLRLVLEDDHD